MWRYKNSVLKRFKVFSHYSFLASVLVLWIFLVLVIYQKINNIPFVTQAFAVPKFSTPPGTTPDTAWQTINSSVTIAGTTKVLGDGTGYALVGGGSGCGSSYTGISLWGTAFSGCNNYNFLSNPSDPQLYINRPSGNAMRFREGNTDQMMIASGGNVEIGTATPYSALSIYRNISQTPSLTHNTAALFDITNALTDVAFTIDQNFPFGLSIQHRHASLDGYGYPINLNPLAGNIGIGTTNPSYKLDVSGDVRANGGWLRNNGAQGWYNDTYGSGLYMADSSWIRSYGPAGLWLNSATVATNGSFSAGYGGGAGPAGGAIFAGNVGIGLPSPARALDVVGDIGSTGTVSGSVGSFGNLTVGRTTTTVYLNATHVNSSSDISAPSITGSSSITTPSLSATNLNSTNLTTNIIKSNDFQSVSNPSYYHMAPDTTSQVHTWYMDSAFAGALTVYGNIYAQGNISAGGSKAGYVVDFAINDSNEVLNQGDVVTLSSNDSNSFSVGEIPLVRVKKATQQDVGKPLWIVDQQTTKNGSTYSYSDDPINPGQSLDMVTLGSYKDVKVNNSGGAIVPGAALAVSAIPGMATKATGTGMILGYAMETLTGSSGMVKVFYSPSSYFDAYSYLSSTDGATISEVLNGKYQIKDPAGNVITKVAQLAEAVIGNLKAGVIEAQRVVINGVDVMERLNAQQQTIDSQQQQIDQLKQQVEELKNAQAK